MSHLNIFPICLENNRRSPTARRWTIESATWKLTGSGKRRGNQNKENRFSISEGNQEPPKKIFPDDFWLRRPILFLSLQTAGPRAFIGSLVTIKAHRSVMTSAAVGLFGSEGCVQFTQCSQSYSGNCWIFMPTCPLPSSGWPYQMLKKTHMRSLTPEWAFFISETDLVSSGWVIARSQLFFPLGAIKAGPLPNI